MRVRLLVGGGICLIALAVFLFARPTITSAPGKAKDQTAAATSHLTKPVNSWIRGGLCRVWDDYCDGPWYCQVSQRLPAECQPSQIYGAVVYTRWVFWSSLALGVLFLMFLITALRGFRADPKKPWLCSSGGTDFEICHSYGPVVDIQETRDVVVWNDVRVDVWDNVHVRSGAKTISNWWAVVRSAATGGTYGVLLRGMRVNEGYNLHSFWARTGRERSENLAHVNSYDDSLWTTKAAIAACVKVDWWPMVAFVPLQAILFRWFAVFPIAAGLLLYGAFQSVASETRAEEFEKHLSRYARSRARSAPSPTHSLS